MSRIDEIFAFVFEDTGPEDEGIIATSLGGIGITLVGADMSWAESLKPIARQIVQQTGKKVKLLRFSTREELEEINSGG